MKPRLAQRMSAVAPSATLAVTEKARALRESGVDVIGFGAGEPDFDTPPHVCDALTRAVCGGDTKYPTPVAGKNPLRQAICEYLKRYCDLPYEPAQVCVTVGVKDALFLAFAALLDPGDEVIIPVPYWVSYPDQVKLFGGVPVFVRRPDRDDLKVSAADIAKAITPRTRVLVLNSPSNPTGAVYSRGELEEIADTIRNTDIVVVSDEIYHRLIFTDQPFTAFASIPGMLERTLTANGVSKTFAMTGWRLGYAAGPAWLISAMVKLIGQTTTGAPSFIQTAAIEALRGPQEFVEQMRQAYSARGRRMAQALARIPGVKCMQPHGAFFCFPEVSDTFAKLGVKDADGFAEVLLERAHVALVSGTAFGCPTHVRLSFATSDREIDEGVARIAQLLQS